MGMKARSTERKKTWHWLRVVEQPPFTYIHDGYNTSNACPQRSASAHLRMASLPLAPAAILRSPFMLAAFRPSSLYWAL